MAPQTALEQWADWAQIASVIAIGVATLIALVTVVIARRTTKLATTYRYLDRQESEEQSVLLNWASSVWTLSGSDTIETGKARFEALSDDEQRRIFRVFNLYEEVSSVFLARQLNQSIFRQQIAPTLMEDWRAAHWLVNYLRMDKGVVDKDVWHQWQAVYCRMIQARVLYTAVPDSDPTEDICDETAGGIWHSLWPPDQQPAAIVRTPSPTTPPAPANLPTDNQAPAPTLRRLSGPVAAAFGVAAGFGIALLVMRRRRGAS